MTEPVWSVGLMTGTALDGFIDAALLRTDGEEIAAFGAWRLQAYDAGLRARLAASIDAARAWDFAGPEPDAVTAAEADYTRAHALAVAALLDEAGLAPSDVAVIGFHGLTVLHRPAAGRTRQIGDGALLARLTGIPVAFDFRSADVAAGGQGAPLAPVYHAALLRNAGLADPAAVLNLGGVANITWWGGGEEVAAFDCGPANGPLNEWVEAHGLGAYDRDGRLAASGMVHEGLLLQLLDHPWLGEAWPKSLDRYDFSASMVRGLSPADGAATLTAFTAAAIGIGLDICPKRPDAVVACGGGRKNPVLIAEIERRARVRVIPAEQVGWRGDAIEAEAFAHLAVRTLRGLPLSFPSTTGVAAPTPGGRVARP
jgi:anhydro-N-acetylmuramic acid kinase